VTQGLLKTASHKSLGQIGITHGISSSPMEKACPAPSITKSIAISPKGALPVDDLADHGDPPNGLANWLLRRSKNKMAADAIATKRGVFDDPYLAPHYMPRPDYENLHRFDINARWTVRKEKVYTS
jgi:hypothetical protein